ncbi:MAG: porin [Gammaproteobacteria bacterium]|nr:porin [Gammaproteobacteria bacterium]
MSGIATASLISVCAQAVAQPSNLDARIEALEKQVTVLADQLEKKTATNNSTNDNIHLGGYGEIHYNNYDDGIDNKIDFHRFVLFVGHDFSDDIRFFSEIEIEHALAGEGKPGEVELEQAYIEFAVNKSLNIKGGLFLIPIGILNETHEPPTFYGTERNPIENKIIPSTWWEGGIGANGNMGAGFSYDIAVHSGLDGGTNIRDGRQKVAEATANQLATTMRIKYTGVAGLEIATSLQRQNDMTQNDTDIIDGATLFSAHIVYQGDKLGARALYADWEFDGNSAGSKDEQQGFYIEGSYKIISQLGVFARQNIWNNSSANISTVKNSTQTDFGFNYWAHENVVVKLDFQQQNVEAGNKDGYNIGLGYQF